MFLVNTAALFLLPLLLVPAIHAHPDNQLSQEEKADGWKLLFDGEGMSQWRNFKRDGISPLWVVEDGVMTLTGRGGGDLITRRQYRNFELVIDWKVVEVGNSGIFFLADEEAKQVYAHAPEVQILDNERHPDNKIDTHLAGSIYDLVASPAKSHRPAGQWNRTRMMLEERRFRLRHNGIFVADIEIGGERWRRLVAASKFRDWEGFGENRQGHIGLQDHGDRVQFKNLKIREIGPESASTSHNE